MDHLIVNADSTGCRSSGMAVTVGPLAAPEQGVGSKSLGLLRRKYTVRLARRRRVTRSPNIADQWMFRDPLVYGLAALALP